MTSQFESLNGHDRSLAKVLVVIVVLVLILILMPVRLTTTHLDRQIIDQLPQRDQFLLHTTQLVVMVADRVSGSGDRIGQQVRLQLADIDAFVGRGDGAGHGV